MEVGLQKHVRARLRHKILILRKLALCMKQEVLCGGWSAEARAGAAETQNPDSKKIGVVHEARSVVWRLICRSTCGRG